MEKTAFNYVVTGGARLILILIAASIALAAVACMSGCTRVEIKLDIIEIGKAEMQAKTGNPFAVSSVTFDAEARTSNTLESSYRRVSIGRSQDQTGQNAALATVAGVVGGILGGAVLP